MCGIAGIVAPEVRQYQAPLDRMVQALRHRGPDGSGTHFFPTCALGHRRLSIVDLCTGAQPMLMPHRPVGVTFNGEIYGFQRLKDQLTDYPFQTTSDTELILALYQRDGTEFVKHLPGMFAFALWDDSRGELLAARDRFGEKPFYYAFGRKDEFLFASEIKALLAADLFEPILSRRALASYLQRLYVHPHHTIYENVLVLPPAHTLRYQNGRVRVDTYWELPIPAANSLPMAQAAERFGDLFEQAVRRQLVADVPVGVFLSGGLDSSTIVAAASKFRDRVKTFSFGFEEYMNELPYARDVARQYNTDHVELTINREDLVPLLETMQEVYDEPFADSSHIPTYLICKRAREHIKVILAGDGGDELLAGYWGVYRPLLWMQGERDRPWWQVAWKRLLTKIVSWVRPAQTWVFEQRTLGAIYRRRYATIAQAHDAIRTFFPADELAALGLNPETWPAAGFRAEQALETVDDAMRIDLQNYMVGDILVKTDRASMAHGLELRAPFLDWEFASFCASLPHQLKLDQEADKLILRQAYGDRWPPSVRQRNKQGFGGPVHLWLKDPGVVGLKDRYLNDPRQKIFDFLSFSKSRPLVGRDNLKTWILLTLSMWMERHAFHFEEAKPARKSCWQERDLHRVPEGVGRR